MEWNVYGGEQALEFLLTTYIIQAGMLYCCLATVRHGAYSTFFDIGNCAPYFATTATKNSICTANHSKKKKVSSININIKLIKLFHEQTLYYIIWSHLMSHLLQVFTPAEPFPNVYSIDLVYRFTDYSRLQTCAVVQVLCVRIFVKQQGSVLCLH